MNQTAEKTICDSCGEEVYKRFISIQNFCNYDTSNKDAYIKSLMKLENVNKEVATSWAEHGLYEKCSK